MADIPPMLNVHAGQLRHTHTHTHTWIGGQVLIDTIQSRNFWWDEEDDDDDEEERGEIKGAL